jgi:hypothetical protein
MSHRYDSAWISGAHLFGNAGLGVLAETIPDDGDDGASYLYNDLSLPADNGKEICGRITTWPGSGTLTAYEDGSFEFDAVDGAHSFRYQLYVDGVATGSPATVDLLVGSVPVTITCNLGTAAAVGFAATITQAQTIDCTTGTAAGVGYQAVIAQGGIIVCSLGVASAVGYRVTITNQAAGLTLTPDDIAAIADAVWDQPIDGAVTARQLVVMMAKILRNKMITDPAAGTLTVYDDDSTTPLLSANIFKDAAGAVPYNGTGAERRERLT